MRRQVERADRGLARGRWAGDEPMMSKPLPHALGGRRVRSGRNGGRAQARHLGLFGGDELRARGLAFNLLDTPPRSGRRRRSTQSAARSRNAASMRVCHRSGGSNTSKSDEQVWGRVITARYSRRICRLTESGSLLQAGRAQPAPGRETARWWLSRIRGRWYRRSSPSVFVVQVLAAQAQPLGPRSEVVSWQSVDIERLAGVLAGGRERQSDRDFVLAGRHGGGGGAGNAVVRAD